MNYSQTLLKDRRYIVTGVTGGAGHATALLISQLGGRVTCLAPDPERTERVKRELHGGGHDTFIAGQYHGIFHASGKELVLPSAMITEEAISGVFDAAVAPAFELIKKVAARNSLLRDG